MTDRRRRPATLSVSRLVSRTFAGSEAANPRRLLFSEQRQPIPTGFTVDFEQPSPRRLLFRAAAAPSSGSEQLTTYEHQRLASFSTSSGRAAAKPSPFLFCFYPGRVSACRPQPLTAVFRPGRKAHESVPLSISAAALLSVLCSFHFDIVTYKLLLGVFADVQMEVRIGNFMIQLVLIFLITIGSTSYGQTDYLDRYIAKSYFEQYDTLVKEEFNSFIANEIPLGLSRVIEDKNYILPKLSSLHRLVIGEGSHRHLSTSLRFKLQRKLKSHLTAQSCEVIIIERLPSGVFADPFELQHLVERGVFTDAAVFGDKNLELPSFRSNQSVVEIHMSIASKVLSKTEDDSEVNLELPLHARYQPLGHGFSRVEFGQPDVFICCGLKLKVPDMNCMPFPISDMLQNNCSPVIWEIPCGSHEHAGLVSAVTFGFAIVAAMIIVLVSVCYSDGRTSNKPKLS
ncbi:Unknown protein [Striga hermonthica]|uniref:Phosphatidylinositol-glycan biosynthesis class X protein n=1 Tax=Striga hermonthica TaxID=68872 RepID=A0A9N7P075_STRHE|nr:Unknown protein [Striga hermonthica]